MISQRTFRLPEDASRVPRDIGGIYQFCLRFPSDYELGLHHVAVNVGAARDHVLKFLSEVSLLFGGLGLTGFLRTPAQARHLQVQFDITGKRLDTKWCNERIAHYLRDSMRDAPAARAATKVLRMVFETAPPVYIGIASRQSLGARLEQHLAGKTGVAERIEKLGISWRYFEFRCTPLESEVASNLTELEKLLQTIFKPQLSER
jgi:hypothetical protein